MWRITQNPSNPLSISLDPFKSDPKKIKKPDIKGSSEVLEQIARGIHKKDDPVLGDDTKCVPWYGDVTRDDKQAAIRMVKPGESQESITYVNRVLAFIFATDESFEQLMRLPKEPFRMSCPKPLKPPINFARPLQIRP